MIKKNLSDKEYNKRCLALFVIFSLLIFLNKEFMQIIFDFYNWKLKGKQNSIKIIVILW